MSEPAPESPPEPASGPFAHIEDWTSRHLAPDIRAGLADALIKAENAAIAARKAAPVLEELASVLGELVKTAPAAAALIPRAEAVIAEAAKVAEMLAL